MTENIYAVRLTENAVNDIDAFLARLRESSGQSAANAWRGELLDTLGTLATMPHRCAAARESASFRRGPVRQLFHPRLRGRPTHRILFTIHDEPDDAPFVRIQHIRHTAQGPLTAEEAQALEEPE